jgi:hypothetical protein
MILDASSTKIVTMEAKISNPIPMITSSALEITSNIFFSSVV